jgi:transcriptional regulator with XRE-family HTH domain
MTAIEAASLLRIHRIEAGISQAELAHRSGYSQCSISHWEIMRKRGSMASYIDVANALGYDVEIIWKMRCTS